MSTTSEQKSGRSFIVKSTSAATAATVSSALVVCGGSSAPAAEFRYGVASGDASRKMISTTQQAWLVKGMAASSASNRQPVR